MKKTIKTKKDVKKTNAKKHSKTQTKIALGLSAAIAVAATTSIAVAMTVGQDKPSKDDALIKSVTTNDINSVIRTDSNKLPSEIKNIPDSTTHNGIHCVFTIKDRNDEAGTITWEAILTKGKASSTVSGVKDGHLTIEDKLTREDGKNVRTITSQMVKALIKPESSKFPSEIRSLPKVMVSNGIYCAFTIIGRDDATGTISWKGTLSKYKVTRTIKGTKSGYLTNDQDYINKISTRTVNNLITAVPSTIPYHIKVLKAQDKTSDGVSYRFTIISRDDSNGAITWSAVLSKNGFTRTIIGTKTGYKILSDEQAIKNVESEDILNGFITPEAKIPWKVKSIPGVITPDGVHVKFTIIGHSDDQGYVQWRATLTKGSTSKEVTGYKMGYTKLPDVLAFRNVDMNLIASLFEVDPNKLPSEFKQELDAKWEKEEKGKPADQQIQKNQVIKMAPNGMEVKFDITKYDDSTGTISWDAELWRNYTNVTKPGSSSGFKTTSQVATPTSTKDSQ